MMLDLRGQLSRPAQEEDRSLLELVLCSVAHPILTLLTRLPDPHFMHYLLYRQKPCKRSLPPLGLGGGGVRARPEVR